MAKATGGQHGTPQFNTGVEIKGTEAIVLGGPDENQAPGCNDRTAEAGRAPAQGQGHGHQPVEGTQRRLPQDFAGLQVHGHQR